jgi:two-component system OmpR family sensor kinase
MSRFGLRTRLFVWLLAAVIAGMIASQGWILLRSEIDSGPMHTTSRALASEVAAEWDDEAAVDAAVKRVHETTGVDFRVRRDAINLPSDVRARPTGLIFDRGFVFVPVVRDGHVVGALQFSMASPPRRGVRPAVFVCVALLVLGVAARSVSGLVVRPLERVAEAAHRFGDGNLTARTDIDARASPEVREVAHAFDAMATRVERMVRDQRDLLAAVSHELRSPLGRARVALELARDQGSNAPAIERVERALAELDTILGDLLSITRAGLSDLHKEPTPLVAFLRKKFTEGGGDVGRVTVDGDEAVIAPIDPALFGRAVANIIENARDHGGPGEIHVTVEPHGDRAVVSVVDAGGGLSPELIAKAFDPFVRGDGARRHQKSSDHQSTGLGLAIVRRVIEAHGGSAQIRNVERDGKVVGAEVSLEVPAA